MGKFSSMVMVISTLVMLLVATASGNTTKTICNVKISELAECLPALTGQPPPPPTKACCRVLQKADLRCLCNFKSELVKYGVKPANALAVPKKCGLKLPWQCKARL